MNFNYFYGNEADIYSFYRIPKILFTGKDYIEISTDAKLLYGILIDRIGMSLKNEWVDDNNRAYIIYSISEIQEDLNVSKKKAIEYLGELEKHGLVEKRVRGLGLPSLLYPMNFSKEHK